MERQLPRYVAIIEAYIARKLSLPDAARQLAAALDGAAVNFAITPQLRPLLAEVQRLRTGSSPMPGPPFDADPDRHKDGNLDLLNGLAESFWETLKRYDHPTRLHVSFDAATKQDADRIAEWLVRHGHTVRSKTPAEADSDDWVVRGTSPSKQWSPELLAEWVELLRSAPLNGSASIHGAGVAPAV